MQQRPKSIQHTHVQSPLTSIESCPCPASRPCRLRTQFTGRHDSNLRKSCTTAPHQDKSLLQHLRPVPCPPSQSGDAYPTTDKDAPTHRTARTGVVRRLNITASWHSMEARQNISRALTLSTGCISFMVIPTW